jgi:cell division protein FtsL
MTVARGLALLGLFAVLAIGAVHVRAEQVRMAARAQELRTEQLVLRREAWALQVEIARLRTPDQILDRVQRWELAVAPPEIKPEQEKALLASR